jgi:hypothetical protein
MVPSIENAEHYIINKTSEGCHPAEVSISIPISITNYYLPTTYALSKYLSIS